MPPFNISGCTDLTSLDIQYDKRYGINRWPDYTIFGNYSNENVANPSSSSGTSNYWSASSSELKQWLVDGHPQWVWDFAFWQENHLLRTIAYNLGSRTATTGTKASINRVSLGEIMVSRMIPPTTPRPATAGSWTKRRRWTRSSRWRAARASGAPGCRAARRAALPPRQDQSLDGEPSHRTHGR